ncbi:MAG TPA: hypothetical protein VGK53_11490 [Propionicimonas sp.]|jgi:hypothetical protein
MQLEHLCDVEWRYQLLKELPARDGRDGRVYGEGEARFSGRLSGVARWSNFPRLRDGYAHPDARGVLETADGGLVFFTLAGLSDLTDGAGVHVMTFATDHAPSAWVNTVIAVGEGSIDPERAALSMRYYSCVVDYRPTIPAELPS